MIRRVRYIGEPEMPLSETYPRGVLFVGRQRLNRDTGKIEDRIEGTAFLVRVRVLGGTFPYVITAGHVVDGSDESFVRVPLRDGRVSDIPVPEWVPHEKHDVAAQRVLLPPNHDLVATDLSQFVDDPHWTDPAEIADYWHPDGFQLELGDPVYFVGLVGKIEAMTERNIPMVRAGTLGRLWQERVPVRRSPDDAVRFITAHLIDCRSFAGFSGAPCYVQQATVGRNRRVIGIAHRTALLGLIGGHFDDWARTRDREDTREADDYMGGISDNIEAPVSTGVGYVIPAEFIRQTLMRKELKDVRDEAEKADAAREEDAASMDSAAPVEANEYENFKTLARKLVNTPKRELDEKRKDES